jgi:shikimate dehydrogenase
MQQAAFDVLGIEAHYALWETQPGGLIEIIASLRFSEILGANVTIPYKGNVVPMVDECDPLATRIGAINTIVNRNGRLLGYNTDAPGFSRALTEFAAFDCSGKRVVILGTGGAARAVSIALLGYEVAELIVFGRNEQHVNNLVRHLRALTTEMQGTTCIYDALLGSPGASRFLTTVDLVVNATPVGLKADDTALPIDVKILPTTALVMDTIYDPPLTSLLRAAKSHGCQVINGLPMLLYQGALAFELWTGCPAPIEVMQGALGLAKEG